MQCSPCLIVQIHDVDAPQEDLLPTTNELGIGILAYSPLSRGWLSGTLKTPADIPEGDFRKHLPRFSEEAFKQVHFITF